MAQTGLFRGEKWIEREKERERVESEKGGDYMALLDGNPGQHTG